MRSLVAAFCIALPLAAMNVAGVDWSDRKEYDLVLTIRSETSPQKRLTLLDQWSKSYPKTALAHARNELYLNTYEILADRGHMFEVANQMLVGQPDDPVGVYWLTVLTPQQSSTSPEILDVGDKAARQLLASLDTNFAAARKPATLTETAWNEQRKNVEALAHRALGWSSWQRGNLPAAADELTVCLQKNSGLAEISSWLGIISAVDTGKQPQGLWHLARATTKDLSAPLSEEQRRQVNAMLENMYASYHGSLEGIENLRKASASNAFPPPQFTLDPATVVSARKAEAELSLTNPELAAWLAIRRQLEAPDGEKYFAGDLQNKPLPKLHGTVLRATPLRAAHEITLSMNDSGTPDITLKLSTPLNRPAPPGTNLSFEGVSNEFTRSPFGLVVTAATALPQARPPTAP